MADQQPDVVILDDKGTEHVFPPGFDPKRAAAIVRAQGSATSTEKPRTNLDRLVDVLPAAGGMVGGMAGGIPGAAMGGAAAKGYGDLISNFTALPGAIADVARNLVTQPGATVRGGVQGMAEGAKDAGITGGVQALYELGGQAVSKGLSVGGRAVYRGYLKPSLTKAGLDKAPEIVETGIKELIPITEGGSARLQGVMQNVRAEVDRIIANAKGDINLSDVADKVRDFAKQQYYRPGQSLEDFNAAMKVADELDQHPSLANPFAPNTPPTASPAAANDIKRGIYRAVGDTNYGVERGATTTARKVGGNAMKTSIETVAPGVTGPNERLGNLMDLSDAIDRAVGREGNRNQLFGVPSLLSAGTGLTKAASGTSPLGAVAMAMATRAGLMPAVASRAAIYAAYLGDRMPGTAVADVARLAVGLASEASQQTKQ